MYMSYLKLNIEQTIWEMYSYNSYAKPCGTVASSVIYFHPSPSINVILKKISNLVNKQYNFFLFLARYIGGAKEISPISRHIFFTYLRDWMSVRQ